MSKRLIKAEKDLDIRGNYVVHVDMGKYLFGYGNDSKIFMAIKKASPKINWIYFGLEDNLLVLCTKESFEPFEIDLAQLKLCKI